MITPLNPRSVPASPFYSQGVQAAGVDRLVFVSGQVGVRADGSVADGITEQARVAVENLYAVVAEAGMTADDIVKITIYLTDDVDIEPFMKATGGTLPEQPPATTLLIVKQLAAPELRVEIEAIAAR